MDTDDNLWHHNVFDPGVPHACPLGDTDLGTGNSQDRGDPEEPDPDDPTQRRYAPRAWTVCPHESFTVPDDTALWLVGNTRTQLGTYGYQVFVTSPGAPDIGPALLADPDAFPVRIQNITTVGPANAEVITSP